jgi:hypothetical protein
MRRGVVSFCDRNKTTADTNTAKNKQYSVNLMTLTTAASFAIIRRQFDFRSIEIDRWVTPAERDFAAVCFHQTLCDLTAILNSPEWLISSRSPLSLQYGIGGRRGGAAHYVPPTRQLALAKNAGVGSLAHEWLCASDHYMGVEVFMTRPSKALPPVPGLTANSKKGVR